MVTPKGRMNPQPSGMTVPDESFRVDPSHFPRPQEPVNPLSGYGRNPFGTALWNTAVGAGGAVGDIGRRFFVPGQWQWGKDAAGDPVEYNPAFQPGPADPMAQRAGYGLIDAMTMGLPTGPPDFETMTGPDIALQFADLVDPTGLGGDVARLASKAIPEGTVAGLAWPSWYMRETRPPKGINEKTVDKLEDMWKHPIWTDDRWVRTPEPDQIREIGARALHMDDLANDVPNTSVDMYRQQGSGAGQTLQQKIRDIQSWNRISGRDPQQLTKESDHFNKLAVDLRSGDDELMGRADYWIETHEDDLHDYYRIDMFEDISEPGFENQWGDPIFRTDEQWAKEFDKLSRKLADDAKAAEKRITDDINRIMDEELKIMNRGMEEFTGKGTIGGGSGTLPPQGTGGVLPNAPIPPRGQRLIDMHVKGGFPEELTDKQIAQELWLRTPEGQQYQELYKMKLDSGGMGWNMFYPDESKELDRLTDIYLEQGLSSSELKVYRKQMSQDAAEDAAMFRELDRDIE